MNEIKRRAKALCRRWRLRGTAPLLLFFFALIAAVCGALVSLRVDRLWAAGVCAVIAQGFCGAFRFETQALTLTRATGAAFSFRERGRTLLRLPLLFAVRVGLLLLSLLPAAGLLGAFFSWKNARYPQTALGALLLGCLLTAGVSVVFFLRWNALLRAAPLFLLCGATVRSGLRGSCLLVREKKKDLRALRRSVLLPSLLGLLLLPLPFLALYRRQCEALLFLNEA